MKFNFKWKIFVLKKLNQTHFVSKMKRCFNRQTVSLWNIKIRCVQPKHGFDPQLARLTVCSVYKRMSTIDEHTLSKTLKTKSKSIENVSFIKKWHASEKIEKNLKAVWKFWGRLQINEESIFSYGVDTHPKITIMFEFFILQNHVKRLVQDTIPANCFLARSQ